MGEFLRALFDTDDFPARWQCGNWSPLLGWTHIVADLLIWLAYLGIPVGIAMILRRRRDLPIPSVLWLFVAFITSCGLVHAMDATLFWWPAYRVSAVLKVVTAIVSLATMFALTGFVARVVRTSGFRSALHELQDRERANEQRIQQLSAERVRLLTAVQASGAGLWDWDVDRGAVTLDECASRLLGMSCSADRRSLDEFFGLLHADDRRRVRAEFDTALTQRQELRMQFRTTSAAGVTRHLMLACAAVQHDRGSGLHVTGVLIDVTDRAVGERLFRIAFESAPCGMLLVGQDGGIRMANGNACRLFGYEWAELRELSVEDLVPAGQRDGHAALRHSFFAKAEAREMAAGRDLSAVGREGREIPVEILLSPVVTGDDPAVIATITDITPRKRAAAEREQHAVELERRNHALEEFAYLVSHDLKAPLRAISMISEWLEQDCGPALGDDARRQLGLLRERSRQMHVLIEGSLSYARANLEDSRVESVDVASVLQDVLRLIDAPADAVQVVGTLPRVLYDREQLLKVVMNLIANALHYGAGEQPVRVSASEDDENFTVSIADRGPGIDPRFHEHVFRMFKRVPGSKGESSGVGLAIVRMLVERNGGRVSVASRLGEGAVFSFTIPKRRSERESMQRTEG